ncbi:11941_t:CDS:1, partial [Acaulospora morrowiae]
KEAEERHAKLISELKDKLSEKDQLLSTKNALLAESEAKVQAARAELENAKQSLAVKTAELESRIAEAETNLKNSKEAEETAASRAEELNQLKLEIENIKSNEILQAELIISLESQLQKAEDKRDETITKLEAATKDIEDLNNQITKLQNDIVEASSEVLAQ